MSQAPASYNGHRPQQCTSVAARRSGSFSLRTILATAGVGAFHIPKGSDLVVVGFRYPPLERLGGRKRHLLSEGREFPGLLGHILKLIAGVLS